MTLLLDLQIEVEGFVLPEKPSIQLWAETALQASGCEASDLTVRIADEDESATLNSRYRHRQGSTNVLSFPFEDPPGVHSGLLGDIVICAAVVEREASMQGKSLESHWAHMVIHGVLHLCGYDHQQDAQAVEMEQLETKILSSLGVPPPYDEQASLS